MLVLTEPRAQKPRLVGAAPERLRQGRDLDRVAERRAGAVGLDVARRSPGSTPADGQRLAITSPARRRSARCSRPCAAPSLLIAEPRITAWIVSPSATRVREPLEHDHADAAAATRARAPRVEGAAVAVGREDAARPGRGSRAAAAGGSRRRRPAPCRTRRSSRLWQAEVDGHQRGRAGGLHGDAGPASGRACRRPRVGRKSLSLPMDSWCSPTALISSGSADEVVEQVGAATCRRRRRRSAPAMAARVVAGVLQRLPGALEEEPVLRVEDLRLARA